MYHIWAEAIPENYLPPLILIFKLWYFIINFIFKKDLLWYQIWPLLSISWLENKETRWPALKLNCIHFIIIMNLKITAKVKHPSESYINNSWKRTSLWSHSLIFDPPGFYCPEEQMTKQSECPEGSYCGTRCIVPSQCPAGTYYSETMGN